MGQFLKYLISLSVIGYAVMVVISAVFGDATALIGAILAVAALASLLLCVLDRLSGVEEKLDRLLRQRELDQEEK